SGGGRMRITMDRYEADWEMVRRGWDIHVRGQGRTFASLEQAVTTLYDESDATDQDLDPFVIADEHGPVGRIEDGASVIFFNFRGDRAIEISRAFDDEEFTAFDRQERPSVCFAGMMEYDGDQHIPARYLVDPPCIESTMSELLIGAQVRQYAIAETQKYGHVTYFWNGNRSGYFDAALESYEEIPSSSTPEELAPEMQAEAVTERLLEAMTEGFDFLRVNFANGDMVGHTGNVEATRRAVECVDRCVGRLVEATRALGGVLIVTADHGNADHMFDTDAGGDVVVRSSHSLNPVPFVIFDPQDPAEAPVVHAAGLEATRAGLANVAATVIEILGFEPPSEFEPSLLGVSDGAG
ncbi:MAG: alkaline phosphatase family protein, partial [Nannocystaceae bacterium]